MSKPEANIKMLSNLSQVIDFELLFSFPPNPLCFLKIYSVSPISRTELGLLWGKYHEVAPALTNFSPGRPHLEGISEA